MTFTPRFMNVVSYLVIDSHTVDETPKLPHGKDIALVFTQLDQVNGV